MEWDLLEITCEGITNEVADALRSMKLQQYLLLRQRTCDGYFVALITTINSRTRSPALSQHGPLLKEPWKMKSGRKKADLGHTLNSIRRTHLHHAYLISHAILPQLYFDGIRDQRPLVAIHSSVLCERYSTIF
jgi:hypothetical protein